MKTWITLDLWSCGLIAFVLGSHRQTIMQDIYSEAQYCASFAGKENCQKLLAQDTEQFPVLKSTVMLPLQAIMPWQGKANALPSIEDALGCERNHLFFLCASLLLLIRQIFCGAERFGKRFVNADICAVLRGNNIRFPRGGRVRLTGTSPAKCY